MSIDVQTINDIILGGLMIREGQKLDYPLAKERAANISMALMGLLDELCPGCVQPAGQQGRRNAGDVVDTSASRYFFDKEQR